MKTLALVFSATFAVSSLAAPTLGAGWFWDLGNGIGFAALAGLLYLSTASARNLHVAAHRFLGYVVLIVTAIHAAWFLFGDAAVVRYIEPGAPHYMWAGIFGFVLLNAMTLLGLPEYRKKIHKTYDSFRYWHRWMAISVIALSAWHVVGARYYLSAWYQTISFLLLCAFASFAYRVGRHNDNLNRRAASAFVVLSLVATLMFAAIRNLSP